MGTAYPCRGGATPRRSIAAVVASPVRTSIGVVVTLAGAGPGDHDELYQAFAAVVAAGEGYPQAPGPITVAEFDDYWLDHKSVVVVARVDGELAGSYYLKPNFAGRAAHIANAGYIVVPGLRGRGIGEALVRHSFDEARGLGFDALQFNLVFESNPARRLYQRLGFQVVGRIPDAVDGEDAIVYWRPLG
jgi:ribosomal protein S18 acetylase RimI-like enzyme